MSDTAARTFSADFKRFFLRGLVVLLPSVLTLWIVVKAYQFVDSAIAEPINQGVRLTLANAAPWWEPLRTKFDPSDVTVANAVASSTKPVTPDAMRVRLRSENIQAWWAAHWYMNLIGLFLAVIAVYITGLLLGGYFGRALYRRIERLITSLPVFKQVYPYVKQIVDFLFSDDKAIKFNRVVIVQYPRKGIWSVGFQTGQSMRAIASQTGDQAVAVFIPSSPTPFTGYTITVPRADVIEVPISVEEAIRFVVSGGVLVPERQQLPEQEPAPAELVAAMVRVTTQEVLATSAQIQSSEPSLGATQHHQQRGMR
jgi:uncharacterized membrane protein